MEYYETVTKREIKSMLHSLNEESGYYCIDMNQSEVSNVCHLTLGDLNDSLSDDSNCFFVKREYSPF